MALQKATIENLDKSTKFSVLFNPKEYLVEKSTQWEPHKNPGGNAPELQFTSGNSMTLSMELFFDTYADRTDVREHTEKLLSLATIDPDKHRPPLCLFVWGSFKFKGVLERVSQRFTMFTNDGIPVRATCNVTFKEAATAATTEPNNSPDHTKRRTVRQGETLSLIAAQEYDNPAEWRRIADANGLRDPLDLKPGQVLTIPPIL